MLEHMIHFGGKNYSPGAENTVVDITPPPCLWIPQGDAHAGSQVVIDFYNNTDPGPGALFDGEHAFIIEERQGGCRLRQEETFRGLLVPAFGTMLDDTEKAFIALNAALKQRVESRRG